jgi:hypothetical protein
VTEGNSGYTNATFRVSLSHPSARPVTVFWVTVPNSAGFHDFVPNVSTVTIPALELEATLTVKVIGDTKRESDESFYVWLFLPDNASVADDLGRGTIVNDDIKS